MGKVLRSVGVEFGQGHGMDLWFGESPRSRESSMREARGRKVRAVCEKGSLRGAGKESGKSQAGEDPTCHCTCHLSPSVGSRWQGLL